MCCSDCPPIAYILPEKQEEPVETPTIKIDKNSFCSNDSTIFPITVTPQGGVVTGSGVSVQNGNNYFFSPANAAIGLHTLSYTANGKTANVQVEVIQAPVAKFSYVVTVNGATSILTLTNETAGRTTQTTYEWFRDGKSFSKEENPAPFEFKTAGPVKSITLNVTNGICQGNQKQEIVMPSEDPTIKIDKDSFCNNDKTEFPIIVTPPGGKVSGDGVNNRADGTSVFVPAEVKTPGLVILTYTVNGKSATTTVEVSETPFANFSIETKTEGGEMTVGFKNESRGISDKTRYEWFIDGKQFSEKRDPDPIIFKTATLPHIILLRETNGQCPSEFSLVINSEIEERTVSVCSNQKRFGIEPNLTPNDVVKVLDSGGLKLKETTLEFSPASTAVSQTTAFKVSYTINGRQVNVTITLIVVDADFLMKLTRNTSPVANFPTLLTLTAKETDALKYNWEITVANGRVLNFTTREVIFNYQQNDVFPGSLVTIRLTVTKTDQTGITCENSAQFVLTDSIFNKHMNAGDFDNHTTA
jgi:hypothetical protein